MILKFTHTSSPSYHFKRSCFKLLFWHDQAIPKGKLFTLKSWAFFAQWSLLSFFHHFCLPDFFPSTAVWGGDHVVRLTQLHHLSGKMGKSSECKTEGHGETSHQVIFMPGTNSTYNFQFKMKYTGRAIPTTPRADTSHLRHPNAVAHVPLSKCATTKGALGWHRQLHWPGPAKEPPG